MPILGDETAICSLDMLNFPHAAGSTDVARNSVRNLEVWYGDISKASKNVGEWKDGGCGAQPGGPATNDGDVVGSLPVERYSNG